jgi:hypothetical protein
MSLINDVDKQREYLEKNLEQLNTVVNAILGYRTELKITEHMDYKKRICLKIEDDRNIQEQCGVMARAFKEVTISSRLYWQENGVFMDFCFCYRHITGGSNGADFGFVSIVDNMVSISPRY